MEERLPELLQAAPAILALCVSFIVYPHRYYERALKHPPAFDQEFSGYVATVQELCAKDQVYCARSLAQMNFACDRKCIGMQDFFDSSSVDAVIAAFRPRCVALTKEEESDPVVLAIVRKFRQRYAGFSRVKENRYGAFYVLQ